MTISLFEQFSCPATMIAAELELLANPERAVQILESLFNGQAKNQFGIPYRALGLPLRCALEVARRLGPVAKPLEGYLAALLREGNSVAAMALGSLGDIADSSVADLAACLAGNDDLAYESAAALIRCAQAKHPLVIEFASSSKSATTCSIKSPGLLQRKAPMLWRRHRTGLQLAHSFQTEIKENRMFSTLFKRHVAPPLYYLIEPCPAEVLGPWAGCFPMHKEVLGYSSLGHFFMRAPESKEYLVLHPFKGSAKSYGEHASIASFEKEVLKDPGFQEYVLRPEHVQAVAKRLGALSEEQIYIPQPYPFIGGSDAPETYVKGNVWVFSHIVAQMGGL